MSKKVKGTRRYHIEIALIDIYPKKGPPEGKKLREFCVVDTDSLRKAREGMKRVEHAACEMIEWADLENEDD